jgi:hypothetical protein
MGLRIAEYDSTDAFPRLEKPWRSLAERAGGVSVFSTWEWQSLCWKHYGAGKQLRLITVWEGTALIGLLPCYIVGTSAFKLLPVRDVQLLGAGSDTSLDYLGPLLDPEHESAVAALIADAVIRARSDWDLLRFTDMGWGPFVELLTAQLQSIDVDHRVRPCHRIQRVQLPRTWDDYLASMHRDRRYRVRHKRRKVLQKFGGQLTVCRTGADLSSAVDDLISLHRKRREAKDATKRRLSQHTLYRVPQRSDRALPE